MPQQRERDLAVLAHIFESGDAAAAVHVGADADVMIDAGLVWDARTAIQRAQDAIGLPETIATTFSGSAAEFRSSLESEPLLILAAVIVIYIVLGVLYESYIHPITILSTLPSAGVGALLALMLLGYDLSVIALIGSFTFSLSMISTRFLRGTSDTVLVTTQTVAVLVFGIVAAPIGWVTPSPRDFVLLCLLGIVAMASHVCVNRSLILAPASVVVPYQYTTIVWAVLFGYLVFGDVPDVWMLTGAAIIVGAGLFIFLRERTLARRESFSEPPP